MRHQKAGSKFNRTGSHRDAMFRNMVTSLFTYGKIRTTDAKAKELRRWADKIISLAKRGDLHARRQALSVVRSKNVVHKLFEEAAERFGTRAGGYTRIIKIGRRTGDGALISLVEFVGPEEKKDKKKKKKAKVTKPSASTPKKETAAKPKVKKEETVAQAETDAEAPEGSEKEAAAEDKKVETAAEPEVESAASSVEESDSAAVEEPEENKETKE